MVVDRFRTLRLAISHEESGLLSFMQGQVGSAFAYLNVYSDEPSRIGNFPSSRCCHFDKLSGNALESSHLLSNVTIVIAFSGSYRLCIEGSYRR